LRDRTTEQLDSAADAINFAISAYFDELKQDEIAKLLRQAIETGDYERFFDPTLTLASDITSESGAARGIAGNA